MERFDKCVQESSETDIVIGILLLLGSLYASIWSKCMWSVTAAWSQYECLINKLVILQEGAQDGFSLKFVCSGMGFAASGSWVVGKEEQRGQTYHKRLTVNGHKAGRLYCFIITTILC